jgi:osmotically inducible protein OsmC
MDQKASAVWNGDLEDGAGTLTTESGVLATTQFGLDGVGTNPEELLAVSLSGDFAMTLARELNREGLHPKRIEATATAILEEGAPGSPISHIQLDVRATVPDCTQDQFIAATLAAKKTCTVARGLNLKIFLNASLEHAPGHT